MFQYAFLRAIQKNNERIIVVGFYELLEAFNNIDANLINISSRNKFFRKIINKITYKVLNPIFAYIADKKIISSISVDYDYIGEYKRELDTYFITKGFFSKIRYLYLGFFQSKNFLNKDLIAFNVKNHYKAVANKFSSMIPQNAYKVFVHIRRRDYDKCLVLGKSALLPLEYYYKLIEWFLENRKDVFFILTGDDVKYIKEKFGYINNSIISENNHPAVDLEIMRNCRGGILSASSFSWWGAYLMENKDIIYAPKYWLGFNSKIEFHYNGFPSFCKEVLI